MTASSEPVDPDEYLDRTLAALADPVRRRVVDLLAAAPRPAGALAGELSVSPSVMSRHLKVLRDCGVVGEESPASDARVRIYSLRPDATVELRSWLETVADGWAEQLDALGEYVERGS